MAIAKKPVSNVKKTNFIDSIIEKGGTSPHSLEHGNNKHIKISLRLPAKMLHVIDNYLKDSISKKTRTCWLREALEEKITKDIMSDK